MQFGVVRKWDSLKGFGFIETDSGDDIFVHSSDLDVTLTAKQMHEGLKVRFDIKSDMKGEKAVHVRKA